MVIGICSVLPKTSYQDGLRKYFSKEEKFDYYWPEFAHLGEQPVNTKEIYFNGIEDTPDNEVFGYQSRYAEYKYIQSSVHGDFRDSLSYWHLGRQFTDHPTLNKDFVISDPDTRIFAVDDLGATHKLYVQCYNNIKAIRPMPIFGTPRL